MFTIQSKKIATWLIIVSFLSGQNAYALPSGQEVVEGNAAFEQVDERTLNITASNNSILQYQTFNIGRDEVVNFILPDINSFSLNRIIGGGTSEILGRITANGNLIFINQDGFHFGAASELSVGGLIASTHDISNANFLAGNLTFQGLGENVETSHTSILNEGFIHTRDGGMAVLIADAIENRGVVEAPLGTAALVAGNLVTVGIGENGFLSIGVDEATAHTILDNHGNPITDQIKNSGTVEANGGKVYFNAQGVSRVFENAINLTGTVRADNVAVGADGVVEFMASGDIQSTGKISAEGGKIKLKAGGDIESFGSLQANLLDENAAAFRVGGIFNIGFSSVQNLDRAITYAANTSVSGSISDIANIVINAGVTITLTGDTTFTADSDANGSGAFTMAATASIAGGGHDLTIKASQNSTLGNISNIDDFVLQESQAASSPTFTANPTTTTWSSITDFSIASGKLNRFTGSGTGGDPYIVYDVFGLQAMNGFLSSTFKLANDITASSTANWSNGQGFNPVGQNGSEFAGSLDGNNYIISNLFMSRLEIDNVGLFGKTSGATISNLGLINMSVAGGNDYVGGLVGQATNATLSNVYSSGTVTGIEHMGGLAGYFQGSITNSYSSATISGDTKLGGLVGTLVTTSTITNSHATGNVSPGTGGLAGGLIGVMTNATISNSYATGNVTGVGSSLGGLIGLGNGIGTITDSYATGNVSSTDSSSFIGGLLGLSSGTNNISNSVALGNVTGGNSTGGLVGSYLQGTISNSHASGNVSGNDKVGGLIGSETGATFTLTNSYSVGAVSGASNVGGLIGTANLASTVTSSYWNTQTSGQATSAVGTGKTTAQLQQQSSYAGWDFNTVWSIQEGHSYPYLGNGDTPPPLPPEPPSPPDSSVINQATNSINTLDVPGIITSPAAPGPSGEMEPEMQFNSGGSNGENGNSGDNSGNGNSNGGGPDGGGQKNYDNPFDAFGTPAADKYKTVVIVFEGAVCVKSYDKQGRRGAKGTLIKENMKAQVELGKAPASGEDQSECA